MTHKIKNKDLAKIPLNSNFQYKILNEGGEKRERVHSREPTDDETCQIKNLPIRGVEYPKRQEGVVLRL